MFATKLSKIPCMSEGIDYHSVFGMIVAKIEMWWIRGGVL